MPNIVRFGVKMKKWKKVLLVIGALIIVIVTFQIIFFTISGKPTIDTKINMEEVGE